MNREKMKTWVIAVMIVSAILFAYLYFFNPLDKVYGSLVTWMMTGCVALMLLTGVVSAKLNVKYLLRSALLLGMTLLYFLLKDTQ